jgi:hypothetical protein
MDEIKLGTARLYPGTFYVIYEETTVKLLFSRDDGKKFRMEVKRAGDWPTAMDLAALLPRSWQLPDCRLGFRLPKSGYRLRKLNSLSGFARPGLKVMAARRSKNRNTHRRRRNDGQTA